MCTSTPVHGEDVCVVCEGVTYMTFVSVHVGVLNVYIQRLEGSTISGSVEYVLYNVCLY